MGYKTDYGLAKNEAWGSFCQRQSHHLLWIYCQWVEFLGWHSGPNDFLNYITLWYFNVAIEHGPFIVDLPINHGDCS